MRYCTINKELKMDKETKDLFFKMGEIKGNYKDYI